VQNSARTTSLHSGAATPTVAVESIQISAIVVSMMKQSGRHLTFDVSEIGESSKQLRYATSSSSCRFSSSADCTYVYVQGPTETHEKYAKTTMYTIHVENRPSYTASVADSGRTLEASRRLAS